MISICYEELDELDMRLNLKNHRFLELVDYVLVMLAVL